MKDKLKARMLSISLLAAMYAGAQSAPSAREGSFIKVLLFKWKEQFSETANPEIATIFTGLAQEVDGLDSLEVKKVIHGGFDTAFFLHFASGKAEQHYKAHALHHALVQKIPELIVDFREFNYEDN